MDTIEKTLGKDTKESKIEIRKRKFEIGIARKNKNYDVYNKLAEQYGLDKISPSDIEPTQKVKVDIQPPSPATPPKTDQRQLTGGGSPKSIGQGIPISSRSSVIEPKGGPTQGPVKTRLLGRIKQKSEGGEPFQSPTKKDRFGRPISQIKLDSALPKRKVVGGGSPSKVLKQQLSVGDVERVGRTISALTQELDDIDKPIRGQEMVGGRDIILRREEIIKELAEKKEEFKHQSQVLSPFKVFTEEEKEAGITRIGAGASSPVKISPKKPTGQFGGGTKQTPIESQIASQTGKGRVEEVDVVDDFGLKKLVSGLETPTHHFIRHLAKARGAQGSWHTEEPKFIFKDVNKKIGTKEAGREYEIVRIQKDVAGGRYLVRKLDQRGKKGGEGDESLLGKTHQVNIGKADDWLQDGDIKISKRKAL